MSDEALAPSDGAETTSVVETNQNSAPVQDQGANPSPQVAGDGKPDKPVTTREALDKAFGKTDLFSEGKETKTAGERDPKTGQFTQKPKEAETKPADAKAAAQPVKTDDQQQQTAQIRPAPSRMSKEAQAAWGQVPEVVRNEIERGYTELQNGIEKYKTAYEPIKQFDEMARQSGTTLQSALTAYVGIEQLLRRDVLAGFREVCKNIGVDHQKVGAALAGVPDDQRPAGDTVEVQQLKQQLANATRKIEGLEQQFTGFSQSSIDRQIKSDIDEFKKDKPHFDEVAPVMAQLLRGDHPQFVAKDLASAYDMAVRLNPEIAAKIEAGKAADAQSAQNAAVQPKPKPAEAAQTGAKAKLSITGSPASGSNPDQRKPAGSTRDALKNAFESVGL